MKRVTDNHSYSRPDEAVTTHLHWDAKVDFNQRQIHATATYDIQVASDVERLMLDCKKVVVPGKFFTSQGRDQCLVGGVFVVTDP